MIIETTDYRVDLEATGRAVLTGILRLDSPLAYDPLMMPIHKALGDTAGRFVIDISGLKFMNSAGITRLSRLILYARDLDKPIAVVASPRVRWQHKTAASLKRLYRDVEVMTA
jgi:hypothetical protein